MVEPADLEMSQYWMMEMELNHQSRNLPRRLAAHAMIHVDPSEKRRVQNRIAQRGYRQRLKESQKLKAAKESNDSKHGENSSNDDDKNNKNTNKNNTDSSTSTQTKRSASRTTSRAYSSTPTLSPPPQLRQHASTTTRKEAWSTTNSPDRRLDAPQREEPLQSRDRSHRPQRPQNFHGEREEYEAQQHSNRASEEREQQAHVQQIQQLQLVHSVQQRQLIQPVRSEDGSSFLSDQMSFSGHWIVPQTMTEKDHSIYSRHANSQSPGQPSPPPYMTPSASSNVSLFEPLIEPVLSDFLPPNSVTIKAADSLHRANKRSRRSTSGSTNVDISDTMSSYIQVNAQSPTNMPSSPLTPNLVVYFINARQEHPPGAGIDCKDQWSESARTTLYGGTALHCAVFHGHESVVLTLLQARANLEVRPPSSCMVVGQQLLPASCAVLLEHRADIQEARTCSGQTPLHLAAQNDQQAIAKLLLQAHVYRPQHQDLQNPERQFITEHANVNATDERGSTPLIIASERGHHEMVKLLVEHGADLEQRDSKGLTALHHASIRGRESAVKLLLEMGADVMG